MASPTADPVIETLPPTMYIASKSELLEEKYVELDGRHQAALVIKENVEMKTAAEQWRVAQGEAASLQAHQEARDAAHGKLEAAVMTVQMTERPKLDAIDEWRSLAAVQEQSVEDAREKVQEASAAHTRAYGSYKSGVAELRSLDRMDDWLADELVSLMKDRAAEQELQALFETVVQRIPGTIAGRVVSQVSSLANDFFQQLYVQAAEPSDFSWDAHDYGVSIHRASGDIPARQASGGEQMTLGIALNLAILHYMAPAVRWLVLDEPTASLDEENRAGLRDFVETLREPMFGGERLFDQLLFISHESKMFEGLGDAILFEDAGVG